MSNHLWVVFVSKIYYDLALQNNSKPSYRGSVRKYDSHSVTIPMSDEVPSL